MGKTLRQIIIMLILKMNLWGILIKHWAPTFWFVSRITKRLCQIFNYQVLLIWLTNLWGSLGFFGMLKGFLWHVCLFVSFLLWILQNPQMSFLGDLIWEKNDYSENKKNHVQRIQRRHSMFGVTFENHTFIMFFHLKPW